MGLVDRRQERMLALYEVYVHDLEYLIGGKAALHVTRYPGDQGGYQLYPSAVADAEYGIASAFVNVHN